MRLKFLILILVILPNLSHSYLFAQAYALDTLISGLPRPVAFTFMPANKIVLTLQDSSVRVYDGSYNYIRTFWNFRDSLYFTGQEGGVLGVCIDPNFSVNHFVYIYYTHFNPASIRVVRFTESNNTGTSPLIIFNHLQAQSGIHYGGNMRFGPDDKLYISVGTGSNNNDAQSVTSPRGKIIRINRNGSIPIDNPFYDDGNPLTGRDDRIWARGLRNSFDFCFSPVNDSLYSTENGNSIDEINFIRKGKNYGWPICEGYCTPYIDSLKQPMTAFNGMVPTGILVYNGSAFPELTGKVIFGSYGFQSLFTAQLTGSLDSISSTSPWAAVGRVTTILQGQDGYVYGLKYDFSTNGALFRIRPYVTGIQSNEFPVKFQLLQNYPNPFNPFTFIRYSIASPGFVNLTLYDPIGKEVSVLLSEYVQAGVYEFKWNAEIYPSGVYFCRMTFGDRSIEKKMVLLK